ncbi:MAG: SpoVR family protein [Candidatus Micrarchaeaceae archaeon]
MAESLDDLLSVDGEKIDVVVMRGSAKDEKYTKEARKIARFMIEKLGLSFGNVEFRIVDNETFAEEMALYVNPFPTWEAGQNKILEEENIKYKQVTIYEMVGHKLYNKVDKKEYTVVYINQNDTYDEILSVMAHVYGHLHVQHNNRLAKSIDSNYNKDSYYRNKYREMERRLGIKTVERLYDYAQTLSGLIDIFPDFHKKEEEDYYSTETIYPKEDTYDVYKFTLENIRFTPWERELLEMIYDVNNLRRRKRIKIMDEGFATFVEDKYAEETAKEDIGLAFKMRSGTLNVADVLSPAQLPYYLGFRLFKDIERRWNEGKHGNLYDLLSDEEKRAYLRRENRGLSEILEVVRMYSDWELIFLYADQDFFKSLVKEIEEKTALVVENMYSGKYPKHIIDTIKASTTQNLDPNILRFKLLLETENYGPIVYVPKGSFSGKKLTLRQDLSFLKRYAKNLSEEEEEEFMKQAYQVFSLDNDFTANSLKRISKLWRIPVELKTMDKDGAPIILFSDGDKLSKTNGGEGPKLEE